MLTHLKKTLLVGLSPIQENLRLSELPSEREYRLMDVEWVKCQNDRWCHLERVNVNAVETVGVYLIWHGGETSRVVRVGQGEIAERLRWHREDPQILAYNQYGALYVTWASVPADKRDGIECYLTETWTPLISKAFPMIFPISVNSPFD